MFSWKVRLFQQISTRHFQKNTIILFQNKFDLFI